MKYKRAILATLCISTGALFAFAPDLDFELSRDFHELPNQKERDRAERDSRDRDDRSAHFDDDFGCPHDYQDGHEIH